MRTALAARCADVVHADSYPRVLDDCESLPRDILLTARQAR